MAAGSGGAAMKDRLLQSFPARVVRRYLTARGPTWATVIAWNLLFAFFPIVLVAITILGLVMQGAGPRIEHELTSAFPGDQGGTVVNALRSFRTAAGPLAVVSFIGLLWSGSALFGAIDQALNELCPSKPRDFIPQRLMAFRMILLFTVLIIPAVSSSSILSILGKLPDTPTFLTSGPAGTLLQIALGVADGALLFAAIYLFVPNRRQRWSDVLPGALTAGALFEGFNLLFPLYFSLNHGFSNYGATFALFFLVLTYAYFVAQILMLAAAVNAELHPPEAARTAADRVATATPADPAVATRDTSPVTGPALPQRR
ncbi:MAG: YihY/virulence factor BrkB family protein [Chloroflexi bacterium]|nr:MAG: YihY/virulence factor BrkB family protein [Chloroflexota bacterium]